MPSRSYISAVLTMIAAIVGVGMFTLPYAGTQAGLLILLGYFVGLGIIQHWLHKIYAEIVLSTKQPHRLPGYAGIYLGSKSKKAMTLLVVVASYGSLLAYTLIGGDFLFQLLRPYWGGTVFFYTSILMALRSAVIAFGLKWITRVETVLTAGLLGTIVVIAAFLGEHASLSNIVLWQPAQIFFPYGAVFFAVNGLIAVNNVCLIMKKESKHIKSALRSGLVISIFIMAFFSIMIMSLSGSTTSPDALSGLGAAVPPAVYAILLLIGLVTVTTSFLIVAEALEEMYIWDLGLPRGLAWLLVAAVPYILYLFGAHDITKVVGLAGAVSGGLLGAFSLAIALRVRSNPEKKSAVRPLLTPLIAHTLTLLFLGGVGYQLWELFG